MGLMQEDHMRSIFTLFFLFQLNLLLAQSQSEPPAIDRQENKQIAVVVFVKGDVKIGNRRLKMGDKLINGEVIKTGDKATCDIQMTSSSSPIVIRIKEKSSFQLTETKQGNETKISSVVESGKAFFNVSRLSSKEKMEVVTPTQTCGVRGTKFEMGVKSSGRERTSVTQGKVTTKPRLAKLEEIDSPLIKNLSTQESEVPSGSFVTLSKEDSEEILNKAGLQEILDNPEDEKFSEKLDQALKNTNFQNSLKNLNLSVQKLNEKALKKKTYTFEELIPIEPHLLERKGLLNDFLTLRNKEKNMLSLIRKLEEENEALKLELESLKANK